MYMYFHMQGKVDIKSQAQKTRATLKALESLMYVCSDGAVLDEINTKLEGVIEDF